MVGDVSLCVHATLTHETRYTDLFTHKRFKSRIEVSTAASQCWNDGIWAHAVSVRKKRIWRIGF